MKRPLIARLTVLFTGVAFTSCGSTATLHRSNGPNYEARIVGSDVDALNVAADNGRVYRVPRDEIADIDHPGNAILTVGASMVAAGALVIAATRNEYDRREGVTVGLSYAVPGLLMGLYGAVVYSRSVSAANVDPALQRALPTPNAVPYPVPSMLPSTFTRDGGVSPDAVAPGDASAPRD